ncbi:MAG: right-handed parallel beta-helix repeat-containing protein [Candidatus Sumerlaeaceae bacterium]|nr:right-handed parallel beta-helix repeat-containing protein [Candidatus Sumerlaeaceae bacterium]
MKAGGCGGSRGAARVLVRMSVIRRLIWALAVVPPTLSGAAAIITVNSDGDSIALDGRITLREAITAANTNAPCSDAPAGSPGYDLIRFAPTVLYSGILVSSSLPAISDQLGISGSSDVLVTISGGGVCRPFSILGGTSVTLERVKVHSGLSAGDGGGIHNLGSLRLVSCYVEQCTATTHGGGIYTGSGSQLRMEFCHLTRCNADYGGGLRASMPAAVELYKCRFTQNDADIYGGGAYFTSSNNVVISDCNFLVNTVAFNGGALYLDTPATIVCSSFWMNEAMGSGGAIRKIANHTVDITNSTFYSNGAGEYGGAVSVTAGTAYLQHVTVTLNRADTLTPAGGDGGGLHAGLAARLVIANCIVADNLDLGGQKPDIAGPIVSSGYNLIGSLGEEVFANHRPGDRYGDPNNTTPPGVGAIRYGEPIDPLLAFLDQNAAYTPTCALLSGSMAINNANPASTTTIDQRRLVVRPQGSAPDIGAFESVLYYQYDDETFDTGGLEPPGSTTGASAFGFNTPGFAWPDYSLAQGAYRGHVTAHASRYRVTGVIANWDAWVPYSSIQSTRILRSKWYVFTGGQSNPSDLNQIPNFRLRLMNRFAANSMLEVFHQNPYDPGNAALACELRPSSLPASPSLYRLDYDPVDVPFLFADSSIEGVARAFEAYALFPQENGYIALTESSTGVYPTTLVHPMVVPAKEYQPDAVGAGDLAVFDPAELSLRKLVPGAVEGDFGTWDDTAPLPTHTQTTAGITLDTSAVGTNRIAVAAREFNPDRNTLDYPHRVRVSEGKQYTIRWKLTSTQQVNRQAQIRMRARSIKFAWSQKFEVGGAWATDGGKTYPLNANNSIAQQTLPGVGCMNPESQGINNGGWYNLMLHTPMSADIRPEFPAGTRLTVSMPNISGQPAPGVNSPSRRDIFLGIDLVDTLSGGLGAPLEQGNVQVEKIEIKSYQLVPD